MFFFFLNLLIKFVNIFSLKINKFDIKNIISKEPFFTNMYKSTHITNLGTFVEIL